MNTRGRRAQNKTDKQGFLEVVAVDASHRLLPNLASGNVRGNRICAASKSLPKVGVHSRGNDTRRDMRRKETGRNHLAKGSGPPSPAVSHADMTNPGIRHTERAHHCCALYDLAPVKVMKNKERPGNCSRLRETKETQQLNATWDLQGTLEQEKHTRATPVFR